jgi:hypothetical protein
MSGRSQGVEFSHNESSKATKRKSWPSKDRPASPRSMVSMVHRTAVISSLWHELRLKENLPEKF